MEKLTKYPLYESRSARHNARVEHPSRWRLIAELLLSPANRVHRYKDLSRRMLEDTIDSFDCRKPCR